MKEIEVGLLVRNTMKVIVDYKRKNKVAPNFIEMSSFHWDMLKKDAERMEDSEPYISLTYDISRNILMGAKIIVNGNLDTGIVRVGVMEEMFSDAELIHAYKSVV
jgi:hypothetical protein